MISSLFKFIPPRPDFFNNYLLRASNRSALNDPFEATPSFEFWADLCLRDGYTRFGGTRDEIISYLEVQPEKSVWAELGISFYQDYGIISLTETKDNLLMWSHYTDKHKGMVLEFDISNDFFHSTYARENNSYLGKIQRVLYRKERLTSVNNNLMIEPYFHKSDEWAYENEHRLLLSLGSADIFMISKENAKAIIEEDFLVEEKLIKLNCKFFGTGGAALSGISNKSNFMSMFKVPKEAIKSISFGCKAKASFKDAVISNLSDDDLNDIALFDAVIDKYDYRLKFKKIEV